MEWYFKRNSRTPQAVSCVEDTTPGGRSSSQTPAPIAEGGQGGAPAIGNAGVWALRCGLYTQGPARLDVTALGYEMVKDLPLSFEQRDHCEEDEPVLLKPQKPDAGM